MEDNPGILNATWFSDEVYFLLDNYVNKECMILGLRKFKICRNQATASRESFTVRKIVRKHV
jgi:hypothetical protein